MILQNEKLHDRNENITDATNPYSILMWEYACRDCSMEFSRPVPRGPAEELMITCTGCGSKALERINIPVLEETAFGS